MIWQRQTPEHKSRVAREDSADQSLSDRADALLAPLHEDEIGWHAWLNVWLIAFVFTTGVTAILLLIGWWQ